jgi:hypothetical protein
MKHEEVIDMVNEQNRLVNVKQKSIVAEDTYTGEKQIINFASIGIQPMRIITDVITY